MKDLEIRYAQPEEVDQLLDLFEEVAAERMWIGTEPGFDRVPKRKHILEAIARPHETPLWIARISGEAAGLLGVFHHRHAGLTIGMLVRAPYRRQRIGQALIDYVFTWAREHGVKELSLRVFPHNEAARMLYERAGFREIERFERDVTRQTGEVWDTILMRKEFE